MSTGLFTTHKGLTSGITRGGLTLSHIVVFLCVNKRMLFYISLFKFQFFKIVTF